MDLIALAFTLAGFAHDPMSASDPIVPPASVLPPEWSAPLEPALSRAFAEDEPKSLFSYTYLEVGWASTDIEDLDETADAVYARASLGLFDMLYLFLDYSGQQLDDISIGGSSGDIDVDVYAPGVGVHFGISPKLDLVGEAAYIFNELNSDTFNNFDSSEQGWTAFGGARWMPMAWDGGGLELNGGARWYDVEGLLSDDQVMAWEAGARLHFLRLLSIGGKYSLLEDDDRFGVDLRVSL